MRAGILRSRFALCSIAAPSLVWLASAGAEAAGRVAGTKVALEAPPGFAPAQQFPGFQKLDLGASIIVNEVPGPVSQLRAGLTAERLARGGMVLLESTGTEVGGRDALLLHVTQTAAGTEFEKWMLVFGDATQSIMIMATFPQAAADSLREPMKQSVLSARWDPAAEVDTFEGLRFRVTETAGLKVANRMSNMVVLTRAGAGGTVSSQDPLMVIGTSISETDLSNLEGFSKQRASQIVQITGLAHIEGEPRTVDDLPAYELTAEARDRKTGTPLRVYQLIVADGRNYFMAQGLVGASQAELFLPQFRQVANSLRRAP